MPLTQRISEAPGSIIVQFAGTFVVWIVAERLGLSGILTIVAYAITIARTAPQRMPARLRVPSYAVWETVVFVLNVLAFMLIGMQLRSISDPSRPERSSCAIAGSPPPCSAWCDSHPHRLGDVLQHRVADDDRAPRLSSKAADGRAHRSGRDRRFHGAGCAASSRWPPPSRCRRVFRSATSSCRRHSPWCWARW